MQTDRHLFFFRFWCLLDPKHAQNKIQRNLKRQKKQDDRYHEMKRFTIQAGNNESPFST